MASKEAPKSFDRRDNLLAIQKAAQETWAKGNVYECDAPAVDSGECAVRCCC